MKIKRKVNLSNMAAKTYGSNSNETELEFELTSDELRNAFYEQQSIYDCEDMMYYMEDEGREWLRTAGYDSEFVNTISQYLDEMGDELRRQMDKYDLSWEYARAEAFQSVLRRVKPSPDAE